MARDLETAKAQLETTKGLLALCRYEEWLFFKKSLEAYRAKMVRVAIGTDGSEQAFYKLRGIYEICDWILAAERKLLQEKGELEHEIRVAEQRHEGDSGKPSRHGTIDLDDPAALNPLANKEVPYG